MGLTESSLMQLIDGLSTELFESLEAKKLMELREPIELIEPMVPIYLMELMER